MVITKRTNFKLQPTKNKHYNGWLNKFNRHREEKIVNSKFSRFFRCTSWIAFCSSSSPVTTHPSHYHRHPNKNVQYIQVDCHLPANFTPLASFNTLRTAITTENDILENLRRYRNKAYRFLKAKQILKQEIKLNFWSTKKSSGSRTWLRTFLLIISLKRINISLSVKVIQGNMKWNLNFFHIFARLNIPT